MNKKLTLGMLTYKNPNSTKVVLESIFRQLKGPLEDEVEVLISDNTENDSIKNLIANSPYVAQISYYKNETNLGFDRNVGNILAKAKGSFCWVLSDNDPLAPDAIREALEVITSHPNLSYICSHAGKKDEKQIFKNFEEFIVSNGYVMPSSGLISRNIFNISKLPTDRSKYFGNLWYHLTVAMDMAAHDEMAVIRDFLEPSTDANCTWASGGVVIDTHSSLNNIIMKMPYMGYSKTTCNILSSKMARSLPQVTASSRLHGRKLDRKTIRLMLSSFSNHPFYVFISLPILLVPPVLLRLIKNIINK